MKNFGFEVFIFFFQKIELLLELIIKKQANSYIFVDILINSLLRYP